MTIVIILITLLFLFYGWFFIISILLFFSVTLLIKLNCVFFIFFVFECLFLNIVVLNFKIIIRLRFLLVHFVSISLFYVNILFFCLFNNMSLSLLLVISLFKFIIFSGYFLEHRLDSSRLIVVFYILISKIFYLVPVLILLNGRNPLINYIFLLLNLKPYIILGWFLFLIILFKLLFLNHTNFILSLINYSSFLVLFSLILGSKYFTLLLFLDFLLFSFMCFLLFFDFSWLGVKSLFILFFYFMFIFGVPPFPTFILDMLIIYFFTFISNFFVLILLFFYSFLVYLFSYLSVFFKINFSLVNRRKLIVSLSSFIFFILLLKIFISFYYFNVFLSFFISKEDLIEALDAVLSVFLGFIILFAPFGLILLFLILVAYLLAWLKDILFEFIDRVINPILSYLYEFVQKIKSYDYKKAILNIKFLLLANTDYVVFYFLYLIFYLFTIKGWIVIIFFKFLYALKFFTILSIKLLSVFFIVFCTVTIKIISIYSTGVYIFFHFFLLRQILIYYTPWFSIKFTNLYNSLVNYLIFLKSNYKFYSYLEEFIIRRLEVLIFVKDSILIEVRNIIPSSTYFSNRKLLFNFISLLTCLIVLSFFIYFTFLLANLILFFLIPSVASRFFTLKFPIPFYNICVPLVILLILLVSLALIYSCDKYLLGMFWALLILLVENVKRIFNRGKMIFNNDFKHLSNKIPFNFSSISKNKDRVIEALDCFLN